MSATTVESPAATNGKPASAVDYVLGLTAEDKEDIFLALIREVITCPHWTEEEFAELAARNGLMVAGALETVNEWSFGVHDEALLEEYEGYDVSPDIANALADAFEKER